MSSLEGKNKKTKFDIDDLYSGNNLFDVELVFDNPKRNHKN
jgi:hypothetical protein